MFFLVYLRLYALPNGPKNICKMSNNCLAKTVRHPAEMLSQYLKDRFFANLNNVLQKRYLDILKRHLKRHPRNISKTLLRQLKTAFLQI